MNAVQPNRHVEHWRSALDQVRQRVSHAAPYRASGKVVREPGPMKHGTTVIAFIEDPDGYKVELIEKKG